MKAVRFSTRRKIALIFFFALFISGCDRYSSPLQDTPPYLIESLRVNDVVIDDVGEIVFVVNELVSLKEEKSGKVGYELILVIKLKDGTSREFRVSETHIRPNVAGSSVVTRWLFETPALLEFLQAKQQSGSAT